MERHKGLVRTIIVAAAVMATIGFTSGAASAATNEYPCRAMYTEIHQIANEAGSFAQAGQWNAFQSAMAQMYSAAQYGGSQRC